MADGKTFEYGQAASEVQFQDEIGKVKNRQGEACIEVTDDQDVGIGTDSPGRKLDIVHASDPQLRLSRVASTTYVDMATTAGDNLLVEGSAAASFYTITRGPTNSYAVYQSNSTGDEDGSGKGLSVGVTNNVAYIWMNGNGDADNGIMKIGTGGANSIEIDATRNAVFIANLSADGNVTLGNADTDAHTLNGTLNLNSAPADLTCSGTTASFVAGETVNRGDVVYYKPADSEMYKAVADAAATSRAVAIAAEDITGGATGRYLLRGFIKDTGTFPTFTAGDVVYTNDTAGPPTDTAPSDSGDFVQVIGWAVDGDTVYFDPGSTIVEIA